MSKVDPGRREVDREHQPRTLRAGRTLEARNSVHDEDEMSDRIRSRETRDLRSAVVEALETIDAKLTFLETALPRVASGGDHRSQLKALRRVFRAVRSVIEP
jgi:hypothetical protein